MFATVAAVTSGSACLREVRIMEDAKPRRLKHAQAARVQTQGEIHFLHAVGRRERYVAAGRKEIVATVGTSPAGEVRAPLRPFAHPAPPARVDGRRARQQRAASGMRAKSSATLEK